MKNIFTRHVAMLLAVLTVFTSLPVFYVSADEMQSVYTVSAEGTPILNDGSFETAESSSVTFESWTLSPGFEITGEDVLDGNYALKHSGAQSTAVSDEITLKEGANYVISLYGKKASASDTLNVSFAGKTMTLSENETWGLMRAFIIGDGNSHPITITASGNVYIDDITVSTEMIINGDFSTSFIPPWKPHSNPQTFWHGEDVAGHVGTIRNTTAAGRFYYGPSHGAAIDIEPGVSYIYSGDAYTESINGHWAYMDFTDFSTGVYSVDDDIYLRPTKEKQWQNISYLWNSSTLDKIALRFITGNNQDNDLNSVYANTVSYFDNISFKKVKVGESLISDGSFEKEAHFESIGEVTTPVAVTKSMENDGICAISTPSSDYSWQTYYHSTSITKYTSEEAASAVPSGNNGTSYSGNVWYANSVNGAGSGVLVDFSDAKIPTENVKAITFRVYGANDTSSEYQPGIRIAKAKDNWVLLGNISQAAANGEWAEVTLDSTTFNGAHSFASISENGYLGKFELVCRENTRSGFYIDDITVTYTPEIAIELGAGQSVGNAHHTDERAKDGTHSLKLSGNAGAATDIIEIEKDTYYYLEGYRMRACGADESATVLAIRGADGKLLHSLNGTMYNQQVNWEMISGTWFSGDNTEIYLSAEALGSGDVYYDNIKLVKIEYYDDGSSIAPNGSFENINTQFSVTGWTLGEGFYMSDDAIGEGYALAHQGNGSASAVSDPVTLKKGANYTASAYIKKATDSDTASISFAGQTAALTTAGQWQVLHLFIIGDGNSYPLSIDVSGNVVIDKVTVSTELIANGEFDTPVTSPWSSHSNGVMAWSDDEIGGRTGTTKSGAANGGGRYYYGVGTSATRPVEQNADYIYSGDIYTSKLSSQWSYLDFNDGNSVTDVYAREEGKWQRVYALYESGESTTAKLRFATDIRSDNGGTANTTDGIGNSWFDNISFKKVILGESLITDEGDIDNSEATETVGILSTGDPRIAITYYPGNVTTSPQNAPEGYEGKVWTVSNGGNANGNGAVIDLAAAKIPAEGVRAINIKMYVVEDSPSNASYPEIRIKCPSDGKWFHYSSVAATTDKWINYTIDSSNIHSESAAMQFTAIADADGYLAPFELTNRSSASSLFYIDDVIVTFENGDTYSLEENVVESTVGQISAWDTTGSVSYDNTLFKIGTQSVKLTDNASAKSHLLALEPNTDYYLEAYRIRTGLAANSDGSVVIADTDGNALVTLTGTLYNQTSVWERLTAIWNSGNNTEAYVTLNSTGTGSVYYDGVRLVKVSYYDNGENLITNPSFESFTGAIHHLPEGWKSTDSEAFLEVVKTPVDDGEKALALTDTAITYNATQLEKFKQYILTAYVYKTDADASLEATVSANAVYGTYSSIAQSGTATTSLTHTYTNTTDSNAESGRWIKLQTRFATTTNTEALITLKANGRVVIDNVSVLPAEEAAIEAKTYISDLEETSSKVLSGSLKKDDDGTDTENPAIYLAEYIGFPKGIRMHPLSNADAYITYNLNGEYDSFRSYVAHDGNMGGHSYGNVQFSIYVDNALADQSPVMSYGQVYWFNVDVSGADTLRLEVNRTSDGYPCDGACYADAALYKEYNNELTITYPAKNSDILNYVYAPDALDFTGIADAEELKVYVNSVYHGSTVPENLQFSYTVDGLSRIAAKEAVIEFIPVIDGEEITDLALSRTIKLGGDTVKIGDAYITRITGINGASTFKRNHSTANTAGATDEPSGNLCIGDSRYVCREGFETHPGSGSAASSAADIDIPVKGSGYKFFRALVGRNSEQSNPNIYDVECIVLADGVQIATTGQLLGQEAIMLTAEIPENTEVITLRTTNYDGQYSCCTTDWLWPVLVKDKSLLYDDGKVVKMYDTNADESEISLADANIHFASAKPINALTLYSDSEGAIVDAVVYRWANTFLSTLSSIPVYNATGTVKNGKAFLAFPTSLNPAEYLILFDGNATIKAYDSDTFGLYTDTALSKSVKLDAWFTDTAESYFAAIEPVYNSYVDMEITTAEKNRVAAEYAAFLENDLASFPASFKIGDTAYKGFGTDFTLNSTSTVTGDDNIRRDVNVFTHTSGLIFRVESNFYPDYNAYEWVIYVNYPDTMTENSPVISQFNSVDLTLEGTDPYLIGNTGDHDQWRPYAKELYNSTFTATPLDGKSTDGDSSYFNFMYGNHGMLYGIGWAGRWNMTLDGSGDYAASDSTRLTAGQDIFNTYLKPGETVRTPFVSFVNYDGRDQDRATNLWRRWLIDCIMPRATENKDGTGEKLPFQPARTGGTASLFRHMTDTTTQDQIDYINAYLDNGIDLTMWWMDTGWFKTLNDAGQVVSLTDPTVTPSINANGWDRMGLWLMDKERLDISQITKHGEDANGIKTILWFEPERISTSNSMLDAYAATNPDYNVSAIRSEWRLNGSNMADYTNPEVVQFFIDRISAIIEESGITVYREDFNTMPDATLKHWVNNDKKQGANREGISENLYIQGHFRLWDTLLEKYPYLYIDSCAMGGRRNDLDTMRRAVPLHKTDAAYSNRRFNQAINSEITRWIPYYGSKTEGSTYTDERLAGFADRYSLRTGLSGTIKMCYSIKDGVHVDWDIIRDVTEEHEAISKYFYSDYYSLISYSKDEGDWAAWEYYDPTEKGGFVLAFRRLSTTPTRLIRLKGLEPEALYKVWLEDRNSPAVYSGSQLMLDGITLALPAAQTSEIVHFAELSTAPADRNLTAYISQVSINGTHNGAIYTDGDFNRFDIRFNMSLRDTVLGNKEGTVEENVGADYLSLMALDGVLLSELEEGQVKMNYDVKNNILNVYISSELLAKDIDHTVTLSEDFSSEVDSILANEVSFLYSAEDSAWSTVEEEPEVTIDGQMLSAQLRSDGTRGLRFSTQINFNELIPDFEAENVTFGTLVTPTEFLTTAGLSEAELTHEIIDSVRVADVIAENVLEYVEDEYAIFTAVVTGIPDDTKQFTARGYVKYTTDGGETFVYHYFDSVTHSVSDVIDSSDLVK